MIGDDLREIQSLIHVKQILLVITTGNQWTTVWRRYILISRGNKEKGGSWSVKAMGILNRTPQVRCIDWAYLQIIGKFSASRIAWVHGDKHGTRWVQRNFRSLKHKLIDLFHDGPLNCQDLLSDNRQHLKTHVAFSLLTFSRVTVLVTLLDCLRNHSDVTTSFIAQAS